MCEDAEVCKWRRGIREYSLNKDLCGKHAPVIVGDIRRVCGEGFRTIYPEALCPCGDFESRENAKEKEKRENKN